MNRKAGRPNLYDSRVVVMMTAELQDALRAYAAKEDSDLSKIMRRALKELLERTS